MFTKPPYLCAMLLAGCLGILTGSTGCLVINAETRDPHMEPRIPPSHRTAGDQQLQYKPYAYELDKVLRQQNTVARELAKRDWDELADELGDWRTYIRRLAGIADTTDDPRTLRELCGQLSTCVEEMWRGQRNRSVADVEKALDAAVPTLDRLSAEFPLAEPAPPAGGQTANSSTSTGVTTTGEPGTNSDR